MRIVRWQTILMKYHTLFFFWKLGKILMKYHTLFFWKLGKMSQNLSSAAVVIGFLRVKMNTKIIFSVFVCLQ